MSEVQRPETGEFNPYYQKYIDKVPAGDIRSILRLQVADTSALVRPLTDQQAAFRYEPGKWSVRQTIGHILDVERIMSYRALRVARGDQTPLPGFEENEYAETAGSDTRTLQSLVAELEALRGSTAALFQHLPEEAWTRVGTANNSPISVRALAYIIAGHELHHREILQSRYLPGLPLPV